MGDEELRALERRWRETGAVEDEARWHLARVRAGALPQARLELAAALGVPGARVALGRRAGVRPPGSMEGLRAWLGEVVVFGDDVQRRAALSVAALGLAEDARARRASGRERTPDLFAAREWFEVAVRATLAPEDLRARARARAVGATLRPLRLGGSLEEALRAIDAATAPTCTVAAWWSRFPRREADPLHRAIVNGLAPWALGLRDPLASLLERTLEQVEVVAPCPIGWETLAPTDDPAVRRCDRCALDVLDLSAVTRSEAEARLEVGRRLGGLCVTLYRRRDGRVATGGCLEALATGLPADERPMGLTF